MSNVTVGGLSLDQRRELDAIIYELERVTLSWAFSGRSSGPEADEATAVRAKLRTYLDSLTDWSRTYESAPSH